MTTHPQTAQHTETSGAPSTEAAILDRLSHCIDRSCVICVEHAASMQPRLTHWQTWEKPQCFNGDLGSIYASIEDCRRKHADHHIRLSVENMTWRSRLSLAVYRPH
ncbi:ribulose bisphosphate carboxylase small subunit [Thiorhodococcus mannitoliphagus]|uniref:Ribulose bisphosphate carboxylase small subunit n=1 Tax=Thiorhodococcus mannitoliphagus TaxID=329406 RepID=A0A6P1DZA6_9GAMM|nr:ribulose bisphosphate carboxylase small subunit [Thiorhodococcus mannitoliphagus]NEX23019.1 ribulose bisphosphate carboxylase small subunit [Thiorhodococcus mannitoliphagus]